MIKKYHDKARANGTILIPQCGTESAPSDIITWAMGQHMRAELGAGLGETIVEIHSLNFEPSGGTLETILGIIESFSPGRLAEEQRPFALSPVDNPTFRNPQDSWWYVLSGVRWVPHLGYLINCLTETFNLPIVYRTWGLLQEEKSRSGEAYGPNFSYREMLRAGNPVWGALANFNSAATSYLLQYSAVRGIVRKVLNKPGEGPDREVDRTFKTEFRAVSTPDPAREDGKQVWARATFSGGSYTRRWKVFPVLVLVLTMRTVTAATLSQAVMTILDDELRLEGGIYTPALLGENYLDRLQSAGFKVEVKVV
jgi:short subunit dehydrogenase-like uncharacterized protein